MYYQPTPINWQTYHFLIMSAPDDNSMKKCIKVRVSHPLSNTPVGLKDTQSEVVSAHL